MSAKMDGVHTRTPQQLEQKLDLGKRFAEVMGIATDARSAADEAKKSVRTLDDKLTPEEVYNRLTNYGQSQGLFRDDDGNLFVNAAYLYALEALFAKDINMTGKFTYTAKVFLEPEEEELETIKKHLLGTENIPTNKIPLYDFNNNGKIDIVDLGKVNKSVLGIESLASWSGAVKTDATVTIDLTDPNKIIRIQGQNMWGRQIDKYIGVKFTNIKNPATEQKLDNLSNAYIPNVVRNHNGAGVGYEIGAINKSAIVFVQDPVDRNSFWLGVVGCVEGQSSFYHTIANNGLTLLGYNAWGTFDFSGGSGGYDFYNMTQSIL